jgi:N-hydroxyarylamine O-acetyltransferase
MNGAPVLDLDAYLTRIGYSGSRSPTLETLRSLHLQHAQTIAFENLNPLMGWPVRLDLPALEEKIVRGGRGGYCFEQNLLLSRALRALGFHVTDLAARVLWRAADDDEIKPRTHMLLLVDLEGDAYIADVGFGGQSLTGPLRLAPDIEQTTPHEPFRLLRAGEDFKLQAYFGKAWKSMYRFDLQPQFEPDYEIANYYLATNPASHFRTSLTAALPAADRRYGLANNFLSTHHLNGPTERRALTSIAEVRQTLEDVFGLTLPSGPDLDAAIARVCDFPR